MTFRACFQTSETVKRPKGLPVHEQVPPEAIVNMLCWKSNPPNPIDENGYRVSLDVIQVTQLSASESES